METMLTTLPYSAHVLCAPPIPAPWRLVHSQAVRHEGSLATGALIVHPATGIYRLYCAGVTTSVPQIDAAVLAGECRDLR